MRLAALQFLLLLTQPLFRQPAFDNLPLQFIVGGDEFPGSLSDPLIEFVGDPLFVDQKPCLLQSDRRLVCRDIQQEPLGFPREVRSPRPCHDDPDFTLQPQPHGQNRQVSVANGVLYQRRPLPRVLFQPAADVLADLFRPEHACLRLTDTNHLYRGLARADHSTAHRRDPGEACSQARRAGCGRSGMDRRHSRWQAAPGG